MAFPIEFVVILSSYAGNTYDLSADISTLDISVCDISKYFLLSRNIVWTQLLFFFTFQLLSSQNHWYLKVNFLGPESLL